MNSIENPSGQGGRPSAPGPSSTLGSPRDIHNGVIIPHPEGA